MENISEWEFLPNAWIVIVFLFCFVIIFIQLLEDFYTMIKAPAVDAAEDSPENVAPENKKHKCLCGIKKANKKYKNNIDQSNQRKPRCLEFKNIKSKEIVSKKQYRFGKNLPRQCKNKEKRNKGVFLPRIKLYNRLNQWKTKQATSIAPVEKESGQCVQCFHKRDIIALSFSPLTLVELAPYREIPKELTPKVTENNPVPSPQNYTEIVYVETNSERSLCLTLTDTCDSLV